MIFLQTILILEIWFFIKRKFSFFFNKKIAQMIAKRNGLTNQKINNSIEKIKYY